MSRRTIGGGRVLGSGRNINVAVAPPTATATAKSALSLPAKVLSPSSSTISLNSTDGSSTPPTLESQDIASRISLDNGAPNLSTPAAGADDGLLVCPICNEEMVTLLQLNRHLDDVHKEIEVQEQDEVKDWFKQQMLRAKKFQPLAVLNQKLKGLDVFESNHEAARGSSTPQLPSETAAAAAGSSRDRSSTPVPPNRPKEVIDPDDVVSKAHWQKRSGQDSCADPTCGKRLGSTSTGIVNCRHCGKLFCEEHTMYQMKLSRSAQHEPVRGLWCRVCETCYKSRDGYNDRRGCERERTTLFSKLRQEKHNKMLIEVSRLEKRLTRLTQLLANPPEEVNMSVAQPQNKRWSLASWTQNDPRKALEQTVVAWQEDTAVARCPYCQQEFTQYTFRRHHCRTCGKVVCGDPTTACSIILPLSVEAKKPAPNNTVSLDIRLCKECNDALFSQRDFEASLTNPQTSSFLKSYQNLLQFERGIRLLIPRFQRLLQALQDPDAILSIQQISDASRTRKRLMDSFAQYDIAARRIRDMSSPSPTQLKLQKAIYDNASQFLHLHMLPLKSLPKVLKHATPNGRPAHNGISPPGQVTGTGTPKSKSALASIHYNHMRNESSSNISVSTMSSRISELEASEKELRERLIVLEEQRFLVQEMIAEANKRRKFDEVAALAGNVQDLSREIDEISNQVEGVLIEIGETYTTDRTASPARGENGNQKGKEAAADYG